MQRALDKYENSTTLIGDDGTSLGKKFPYVNSAIQILISIKQQVQRNLVRLDTRNYGASTTPWKMN